MKITIESTELVTKIGKNSGNPYETQTAYVHLSNEDGSPQLYPRQIKIFPARNSTGASVAYGVGDYLLSPVSFGVDGDFLKLTSMRLTPIKK